MTGSLGQALQALRDASGLLMVSVVGADGLVVEAAADPGVDVESLSAMAVSGLLMMDALGQELEEGSARQAILEYGESVVILTPLDDDLLLVTVARGDFNLGRMRLIIRRFVDQISSAVAAI
ncbi:roadblock/LC7 domain-containing protein [Sphaerobacter sp.]|uniref:roadblock/LC7 domain-containing protein n=1 Tax=Sphaerobacter sp. TaxID=2099654 RepID=UPI001D46B2F5|nr:roadblock/LC7 domain-containing protein [Sphaerobacter sp.]MBX5443741.1 roadblock/LC7 domain-containing protein [Sphaerobacter sp.]